MPKTHEFTDNATGKPIAVVIDKIVVFKKDEFSECTSIELMGQRLAYPKQSIKCRKLSKMPIGPKGEKRPAEKKAASERWK